MSRKGEIGESSTNHIHRKEDEMKRDPLWYTITDWVTRIIISIVVPVIVVSIVQHRNVIDVFKQLITKLSELL